MISQRNEVFILGCSDDLMMMLQYAAAVIVRWHASLVVWCYAIVFIWRCMTVGCYDTVMVPWSEILILPHSDVTPIIKPSADQTTLGILKMLTFLQQGRPQSLLAQSRAVAQIQKHINIGKKPTSVYWVMSGNLYHQIIHKYDTKHWRVLSRCGGKSDPAHLWNLFS